MTDNIFGIIENKKCPVCGKKKVICTIQYPAIITLDMRGIPIFKDYKGKRKYKPSNRDKARVFDTIIRSGEYQCAVYECEACSWQSKIYVP